MSLVTEYLDARGVPYEVIHHDPSRTFPRRPARSTWTPITS